MWGLYGNHIFSVYPLSDVGLWAEWAFFLPGDGLLWAVMQSQPLATFLELTPAVYSGWFSGVVSAIIWLIALAVWVGVAVWFEVKDS